MADVDVGVLAPAGGQRAEQQLLDFDVAFDAGVAVDSASERAATSVVLADVNERALKAAVDKLTSAGHVALAVSCDVSDEEQVAAMVERAVDRFGQRNV